MTVELDESYQFTPSGKPRVLTDEQELELCREYLEGLGTPTLSKKYGCSVSTARKVLKRRGVKQRKSRPRTSFVVQGYRWVPADESNSIDMAMCRPEYTFIMEHRKVMARSIGRPLTSKEQVHHIDGNRLNNSLDNLQLRQGPHGSGVVLRCQACNSFDVAPVELD